MKIIYSNFKNGEVKVRVENLDDLWYLSNIVDAGDIVKGETVRKIKIGGKDERTSEVSRKRVFIVVDVEKTEFSSDASSLRILGRIVEGPDDVAKGSHHSFNVAEGTVITIMKGKWLRFQTEKLKEASEVKAPGILICVFDRDNVMFAIMKRYDYKVLTEFEGDVEKKRFDVLKKDTHSFYTEIIKLLKEYAERHDAEKIILASPAFWKDELMKEVKDDGLKIKIILATCSSVSRNAIDEVIKRPEVKAVLKQDRVAREINAVEELFVEIAKDGIAVYGLKDVEGAVRMGAVKTLYLTNECIRKARAEGFYERIDKALKTADSTNAEIMIISSEHDGGKRLDGLGGIAAIVRYKIKY